MPTIDLKATGLNIKVKIKEKNIAVKDLKDLLGFGTPQAIYKWFKGATLPTLDNLVILAKILDTTLDDLIVLKKAVI